MHIKFGRYELIERISVGGMAEVFKGRVSGVAGFEKIVAIKRILPHLSDDQEFISMFIDEAKISANLNHANIGQVFEFGKIDNCYFLAMEYIHGKDLRGIQDHFCSFNRSMPIPMAVRIILDVSAALDYAHQKNDHTGQPLRIVHRDISPPNILISYEGSVKLIDFGIAKAFRLTSLSFDGSLKGKFSYISPEQVEGEEVDGRSDIFATGAVLFELITGQKLFQSDSDMAILELVRKAEVPPPSKINPAIPKPLDAIVLKALARRPADRYQRADELQDSLESFAQTARMTFSSKQLSRWMKTTFPAEFEGDKDDLKRPEMLRGAKPFAPQQELPSLTKRPRLPSQDNLFTKKQRSPFQGKENETARKTLFKGSDDIITTTLPRGIGNNKKSYTQPLNSITLNAPGNSEESNKTNPPHSSTNPIQPLSQPSSMGIQPATPNFHSDNVHSSSSILEDPFSEKKPDEQNVDADPFLLSSLPVLWPESADWDVTVLEGEKTEIALSDPENDGPTILDLQPTEVNTYANIKARSIDPAILPKLPSSAAEISFDAEKTQADFVIARANNDIVFDEEVFFDDQATSNSPPSYGELVRVSSLREDISTPGIDLYKDPVERPIPAPIKKPAPAPIKKPAPAPIKKPAPAPVEKSVLPPIEQPVLPLIEQPVLSPIEQPVLPPIEQPASFTANPNVFADPLPVSRTGHTPEIVRPRLSSATLMLPELKQIPRASWILWAIIATALVLILGGGVTAYWFITSSREPKASKADLLVPNKHPGLPKTDNPPSAQHAYGTLILESSVPFSGQLYIDGEMKAVIHRTARYSIGKLLPGKHIIGIQSDGNTFNKHVQIWGGKTIVIEIPDISYQPPLANTKDSQINNALIHSSASAIPTVKKQKKVDVPPKKKEKAIPTKALTKKIIRKNKPHPPNTLKTVRAKTDRPGFLIIASKPLARIWVDGKDSGRNTPVPPANPLSLKPGRHKITLIVNSQKFTFPVMINTGKTERLIKVLPIKDKK